MSGRHAVEQALESGREIERVLVASGAAGHLMPLIQRAREKGIPVKEVDRAKLTSLCGEHHQGIAALAALKAYATVADLLSAAEQKQEPPLLVVCDGLEDPHNLGAILRTAEAAGAHGVIIPKRRGVGLTAAAYQASAGAAEYVPVARVSNLSQTLQSLKEGGVWVYGLDMDGENWCQSDLTGPAALVVGAEGKGLSRLVKEQCDFVLSLPMAGHIRSLNASVACSLLLMEAARQRQNIPALNR